MVPANPATQVIEVATEDGLRLYCEALVPSDAQAMALVVHGVAEHLGRYERFARFLAGRRIAYFGYDQRGHGRSEGREVYVESINDYVADLQTVIGTAKQQLAGRPLFIIGHSLGSIVVLYWAAGGREEPEVNGIITLATPTKLAVSAPQWQRSLVHGIATVLPKASLHSLVDVSALSNDAQVAEDYLADELNRSKVTMGWLDAFLSAQDIPDEALRRISLPLLMLHGEADQIASCEGTERTFGIVGSRDKQMRIYPGLKHELLNEREKDRKVVMTDILDWILNRLESR